jgi:hypothetical protein
VLGKSGIFEAVCEQRLKWRTPEKPIGLFLVLVIEKIELVKPVAKRIEDEDENEDDIPAR